MDVREKLIELIESARYWGSNTSEEIAENLIAHGVTVQDNAEITDEFLKQLRNAPLTVFHKEPTIEFVQEWISVKDMLPENDQWALCFMKDKSFGTFRVFQWDYIDWQWNDGNEWFDEKDVTHWMPLPQPPKG